MFIVLIIKLKVFPSLLKIEGHNLPFETLRNISSLNFIISSLNFIQDFRLSFPRELISLVYTLDKHLLLFQKPQILQDKTVRTICLKI